MFAGPVSMNFTRADDLTTGRFRVRSHAAAQVSAHQPSTDTAVRRAGASLTVNGSTHALTPPGLVVGRGSEADLRINDPGVSRRHAEFRVSGGRGLPEVTVVDLGSTNGTLVDGKRVDEAVLREGSSVRIGNTDLVLRFTEER